MFDLAFAIPMVTSETITVTRHSGSYDSSGIWSQSSANTITGLASIQPLNGADVQRLPENMRSDAMVKIWFDQALQVADIGGTPGDRFTWQTDLYETQGKADWSDVGNFYEYYARKVV